MRGLAATSESHGAVPDTPIPRGRVQRSDALAGHVGAHVHALGDGVAVDVEAADGGVEGDEVVDRDGAAPQGGEAVLEAGVVEGAAGEAGGRVAAPQVDLVVLHRAAGAARVLLGVVDLVGRHRRVA